MAELTLSRAAPFTGRTPGQGEQELPNPFDLAATYYSRDKRDRDRISKYIRCVRTWSDRCDVGSRTD